MKSKNPTHKKRGRSFAATRLQHLKETAEDYTELVADLIVHKGEARVCDIARHMSISHVTAIRCIQRLQKEGFLETEPHQPVFLTEKGKRLATHSKKRHSLLMEFLTKLGIPEECAAADVEGMEHHISHKTLQAIAKLLKTL